MPNCWINAPADVKNFVHNLSKIFQETLHARLIGIYLHGSLAMGGFHPARSDIDLIIIVSNSLNMEVRKDLAYIMLEVSNSPYPIEVSILSHNQLEAWEHPSLFEFHYSEAWRNRFMLSLREREENKIYQAGLRDADLAAHLTIIKNRGITLLGEPISKVFPSISPAHYLDSIMRDYNECVDNITKDPVYCTLNIIRVYCYLKEGAIFSKTEGGKWGLANLPEKFHSAIRNVLRKYQYNDTKSRLNLSGLRELRDYIQCQVEKLTENQ